MSQSPTLQVARYRPHGSSDVRLGLLDPENPSVVRDAGTSPHAGFIPSAEAWQNLEPTGPLRPIEEIVFLPPVVPRKVLGIGLNYRDHAEEIGADLPTVPLIFAKLPSALVGHEAPVVVPAQESQPDWEAELALVMGEPAKQITSQQDALAAIGGYTAANDVSGRLAQFGDAEYVRGKGFDTFGPIGPAIHPAEGVQWDTLPITCTVSGVEVQNGTTANLVFSVPELIIYLANQFTLDPGDVILTGTPAGTGMGRRPQTFLRHGDVMEVTVGAVGPLRNPVRFEAGPSP